MKRKYLITAVLLVLALTLCGKYTNAGAAGESPAGTFSFLIGNKEIKDGDTIDYSLYNNKDSTLTIILRNTEGIASGTDFEWVVSNSNIIKVKSQDDATCSVTLDIISPGYSGLSVTMKDPKGTTYTAVAYCSIYVPLQWSDNVSTDEPIFNNIMASNANGNYGLLYGQAGDSTDTVYTLQLYTSNSADHPEASHYLRKLRYVKYGYAKDDPSTTVDETTLLSVESDVDPNNLGPFTAALKWSTSDASVADVDTLTGLITAKSAGFATITVETSTENELLGKTDSLSFDVVVVPEAYVSGYNTSADSKSTGEIVWDYDSVVFQTNAAFASSLEWRVFQGDVISNATEITDDVKKDMEISDANGRMVLDNLKAGVYYITAIPVKGKETATTTPTYDVTTPNIKALAYIVIVPVRFPPDSLTLSYYNQDIYDSFDLLANSNLPAGKFRFISDNPEVASVKPADGVIEAKSEGNTKVKINLSDEEGFDKLFGSYANDPRIKFDKTADKSRSVDVTVYDGIAINTSSATMTLGSELQLSLTAPNPYQGEIYWISKDDSIASVDENGLVTAKKIGTTTVTAQINVGSGVTKRAQCTINVVASVSAIKLTAKDDHMKVGDKLTITAEITPKVSGTVLKWTSSDPSVASISTTNALSITINGEKAGSTVITAVNPDNGVVGTMVIHVVSGITSITLSDHEVVIPKSAGFYQLYCKCEPELPSNEKLTWSSSDNRIITVDQNGKVSIVKPGTAHINVMTSNGLLESCKFTILQGMESIVLDETELVMYVGQTYRMTYSVFPATTSDTTLKWTPTNSKVVTVDNTGFFTAKNTGTCVVTVQAMDGSGVFTTCTVTVLRNASGITLDVKDLKLNVGETYQLEALLNPADSTDTILYESSNKKIAEVSAGGKITAKGKGSCVIFARTDGGSSAYCNVTVSQQVTGLTVSPDSASIEVGEVLELTATITPGNASDKEVTWTSDDPSICTVNEDGEIKGIKGGATLIKCVSEDGDLMAYSMITVIEKVTTITLPETAEVGVGKKLKLTAIVSGDTASNKKLKWKSSKKSVCTVSKSGTITGKKAGKARIWAKATDGSGVKASCVVRVIKATEDIELSASYVSLVQGGKKKIKVTTTPAKTTYSPVWTTDNDKVAIVSKKGTITALKAGDCIVKCTAGDNSEVYAVVYVHVTAPVSISSINLSEDTLVMLTGETTDVQYSVSPANYTESFSWASDNPSVASVNSKGKVTAKSVGTAKITALSASGKKSTATVYVVGLSKTKLTLHQYESTLINLQLDGVESGKVKVSWDTANQSIAEVKNGKVTGKACGKTVVYAKVNGRSLACTVTVIKN
ncbi:MAG: Ig domain-containing protein [Lachnospiraceae bacterium]|nr:Ig domain-containing protein [Lachnospiraceae bacterium]